MAFAPYAHVGRFGLQNTEDDSDPSHPSSLANFSQIASIQIICAPRGTVRVVRGRCSEGELPLENRIIYI